MSDRNPQHRRFAPGTAPVPVGQQIPDRPADSAEWMNDEPPGYEGGALFPDPSPARSVLSDLLDRPGGS